MQVNSGFSQSLEDLLRCSKQSGCQGILIIHLFLQLWLDDGLVNSIDPRE